MVSGGRGAVLVFIPRPCFGRSSHPDVGLLCKSFEVIRKPFEHKCWNRCSK